MTRLVGNDAPYFSMQALAADGETFTRVSLPDYAGKWLVMFFYPMDFTFICPTELTAFSDSRDKFAAAGAEILSVSTDSVHTHLAWQRNGLGKLGYPMASDQTLKVSEAYGVLLEDQGVALRGLFIIDPLLKVRSCTINENSVGRSVDETLRVLEAFKTGGLCGAGWKSGDKNLSPVMPKSDIVGEPKHVKVDIYTNPGCSYCRSVKEFLKEIGVAYKEHDLATEQAGRDFMDKRGYSKLPVTVIGGEEIEGYDMPKIKHALGLQ